MDENAGMQIQPDSFVAFFNALNRNYAIWNIETTNQKGIKRRSLSSQITRRTIWGTEQETR